MTDPSGPDVVLVKDCLQEVMEKVTLRTQVSRWKDNLYTRDNKK